MEEKPKEDKATPKEPDQTPPIKKRSIPRWVRVVLVICVLLVAAGSAYAILNAHKTPKPQSSPKPTPTPQESPDANPASKIIYSRQNNNSPGDLIGTIWMMNLDGSDKMQIDVGSAAAYPIEVLTSSNWVFYKEQPIDGGVTSTVLYVYNLQTKQSTRITPGDQATAAIDLQPVSVSPDGSRVLYDMSYNQIVNGSSACGQQPCPSVDLYPDHPSGMYSYDASTGRTLYLGSLNSSVTNWAQDGVNFYVSGGTVYHNYNFGNYIYKVDADTGAVTSVSAIPNQDFYVYYVYPITSNASIINQNIRQNGEATDNSTLEVTSAGKITVVDTGNICDSSTCVRLSSDLKYALYTKDNEDISLDLTTYQPKTVFRPSAGGVIQGGPIWIDKTQFIEEIQIGEHPNDQHNIIMVDVTTGKSTSLTTTNDDYLINF